MNLDFGKIQSLINQLATFDKMYEHVRVVDPIKKEILFERNKNKKEFIPATNKFWNLYLK